VTHSLIAEVPLVPAAGAVIGYLGSLLLFCLAIALTVLWVQILRSPLVRLAGVSVLHVHPFGWLSTVVNNVDRWLKAAEEGGERGMTWSLHTLMWSLSTGAKLTRDLAEASWHLRNRVVHGETHHVGAKTGQSIDPRIKKLEQEFRGIDARLDELSKREKVQRGAGAAAGTADHAQLQRGIDRLNKRVGHLAHELDAIEHAQAHAGAKARPGEVAVPRTAPRVVPRARPAARHWTDVLTKAAGAALVAFSLARLGLGWLRCSNVAKAGKRLCGMNPGLLDALLAGSTLLVGTISLREFAKEVQAVTEEASGLIHGFIRDD
jgi:hypothetical protein